MVLRYISDTDIAGFQFEFNEQCINSVSGNGWMSGENDFTLSLSTVTDTDYVLGYTLTGGFIPPGEGDLFEIDCGREASIQECINCFQESIISNTSAEEITSTGSWEIPEEFEYEGYTDLD